MCAMPHHTPTDRRNNICMLRYARPSDNDRTELVRQHIAAERLGRLVYQRPRPVCIIFASVSEKHILSKLASSAQIWGALD